MITNSLPQARGSEMVRVEIPMGKYLAMRKYIHINNLRGPSEEHRILDHFPHPAPARESPSVQLVRTRNFKMRPTEKQIVAKILRGIVATIEKLIAHLEGETDA